MKQRLMELISNIKTSADDTRTFEDVIATELLANGVIVLPVKFGQTVFVICNTVERIKLKIETCIYETKIDHISIGARGPEFHLIYRCITHPDCDWFVEKDIGKTVFLTREEAEKALAERGEE